MLMYHETVKKGVHLILAPTPANEDEGEIAAQRQVASRYEYDNADIEKELLPESLDDRDHIGVRGIDYTNEVN